MPLHLPPSRRSSYSTKTILHYHYICTVFLLSVTWELQLPRNAAVDGITLQFIDERFKTHSSCRLNGVQQTDSSCSVTADVKANVTNISHYLLVTRNKVLRRIFGPKRDEVTGELRRLHNKELQFCTLIRLIKPRRLIWACSTYWRGVCRV
jgi:hypothetical protein